MRNFKRWLLLLSIAVAMGAVVFDFGPVASSQGNRKGGNTKGKQIAPTSRPGLENYDIRTRSAKDEADQGALKQKSSQLSISSQKHVVTTQSQREAAVSVQQAMSAAQEQLASRVPNLKVIYNEAMSRPEIVRVEGAGALASSDAVSAAGPKEPVVRGFIVENAALYGLTRSQAVQLKKVSDYTNPSGNLSFVEFEQEINGIPVFQGYLRGVVTPDGRLMHTTGLLAPGLRAERLDSTPELSAARAVAAGMGSINHQVGTSDLSVIGTDDDGKQIVSRGPLVEDVKTSLLYFPLVPGHAVLAYSMVLWEPDYAYYVVVNADTGQLLWRKNLTEDQTQAVTYNVYDDDSPTPINPLGPPQAVAPPVPQAPGIARTNITLVSEHESNLLGWIPDSAGPNPVTTGNNVDAGLDIDGVNGIDPGSRPAATNRVFNFVYRPDGSADPAGSTDPANAEFRKGSVVNLFFWSNRYHDRLYDLGFTEAAGNFQLNNFGRGGLGNDFVRAEGQDSSGTNNANFSTPPDGQLPRMQMYIFTGTPNRDGNLDADVVMHELTHGTSNRLHANALGMNNEPGRGMGEGWSDFYALAINSVTGNKRDTDGKQLYNVGAYDTRDYYRAIRRFPYAVKSAVAANGKSHNPLTFADTDPTQINFDDAAFPVGTGSANQVHNQGEVWCTALWEVRGQLVTKYGVLGGNNLILQLVTDGMKLDPAEPTQPSSRDSILAADCASSGGANELQIWEGFRIRGLGMRARTTTEATRVVESFEGPNLRLGTVNAVELSGDGDTVIEPGETVRLTVPLTNILCANSATGVTATATGGTSANYGTVAPGTTETRTVDYTVPTTAACGAAIPVTITVNSSLGPITYTYVVNVGQPSALTTFENFDGVTPPALPAGWTTERRGAGIPWVTSPTRPDTPPNSAFAPNPTNAGTSHLNSPSFPVNTSQGRLSFRNLYNLEDSFDGMQLLIKIGNGQFREIIAAGGSFVSGGYNGNTADGGAAWTGLSAGTTTNPQYITTVVNLPPAASGQIVQLRWTIVADANTTAPGESGARIDTVQLSTSAQTCSRFGVSTASISGRVTDGNGQGIAGIQVTLSGTTNATTTTDANGNYSFPNLVAGGNYTVTPTTPGFESTPPSRTYNNLTADVTDANFTLLAAPSISGRVTTENGAAGIDGITITLTGTESRTTVTSGGGFYSFPALTRGGNYTVTPSGGNNTFTPPSRTYNNLQGPVTDANFIARENLACEAVTPPINGTIGDGDLVQTNRINRDGNPSACSAKPFPGEFAGPGALRYDQYQFTNTSGQAACYKITIQANTGNIFSVAYLNAYNPANRSANYLGDLGSSPTANAAASYTVLVPAGQTLVVVVHETVVGGGGNYSLAVCNSGAPPATTPAPPIAQFGQVLISEFRQSGVPTAGQTNTTANDEYVELYNNTDAPISLTGFVLKTFRGGSDATLNFGGGIIPRRGHLLITNQPTNASGYSLNSYATGDANFNASDLLPVNQGIALVNNNTGEIIDSVGFVGNSGSLPYIEGNGIPRTSNNRPAVQHAYVRKINLTSSFPQDTGDNAADFILVAVDNIPFPGPTAGSTVPTILGAPGPENRSSPVERNQFERLGLVDPLAPSNGGENRKRLGCGAPDTPPCDPNKSAFGFLSIRRKVTNNTGTAVTRLRFRIVDLTTLGSPGDGPGQADLRALTSTTISNVTINGQPTTIDGTTLEEPPNQPRGGGINSSLRVPTITVGTPIENGQSRNVQFLFGVMRDGAFRFIVNIEALP